MTATFVDIDDIKAAIAEVRDDKKPTNWVLLSYQGENSNNVALVGKGDGGPNELIDLLQDDNVGYGIVRLVEKFDANVSDTVKFVYIRWIGENIHRMLRARLGTHTGAIKEILSPYHVNLEASTKDEISEEIIVSTISKASGTAVHVIDKVASSSSQSYASKPPQARAPGSPASSAGSFGVPKQSSNVSFPDEKALRAAIQDVRTDSSDTNWVLASYDAPNSSNVILLGSGAGGSAELLKYLKDDIVAYGLVRQAEKFDDSSRAMFAFVNWTGENIHRMLRAKLSTHSGAIKDIFSPYHVSINASLESEISSDIITTTIRETMGTASKVRN
jgi:hypothetical protein